VMFLLLAAGSCAPNRPSTVPADAVWISVGPDRENVVWQRCEAQANKIDCWIWNGGGEVLESGIFLPLDGQPAPDSATVRLIEREKAGSPTSQVELVSGRILVPEAKFDELLEFNKRLGRIK
jgi:hypothetical protein